MLCACVRRRRPPAPACCRPTSQFHTAAGSVDSADFLPLLRRLDDCIAYVAANPQYADAATYALKFRQLQARALTAVRTKVQQVLRGAAAAVAAAAREAGGGGGQAAAAANGRPGAAPAAPPADGAEAALLYVRFRAAAEPALKGLLQGIEQRAQQSQASGRGQHGRSAWFTICAHVRGRMHPMHRIAACSAKAVAAAQLLAYPHPSLLRRAPHGLQTALLTGTCKQQ